MSGERSAGSRWVPPRVGQRGGRSSEKRLDRCRKLFFLHMRKAAGTSLRGLLGQIAEQRGLEIQVQEGGALDPARLESPDEFSVTCLRDPLERLYSLYNFEGRWHRKDENPSEASARPFDVWLDCEPPPSAPLWHESADYYTKTLAGGPYDQRGIGASGDRYELARRTLDRFDLVLLLEGFGSLEYDAWWRERLLVSPTETMPHRNRTTEQQSRYDIRDHLTETLEQDAVGRNRHDLELYREACRKSPVPITPHR